VSCCGGGGGGGGGGRGGGGGGGGDGGYGTAMMVVKTTQTPKQSQMRCQSLLIPSNHQNLHLHHRCQTRLPSAAFHRPLHPEIN
jgi:hypothetical protein